MEEAQIVLEDHYLTDLVTRHCEWVNENGIKKERYRQQPVADVLPEEMMGAIDNHVGDGVGRVSIGAELGQNKDFCGAKAFVNISVSCNNTLEDCGAVHDIVQPFVRQLVNSDFQAMVEDRNAYTAGAPAEPQQEAGRVSPGPAGARPPVTPKPPVTSATAPRPITRPPAFRR